MVVKLSRSRVVPILAVLLGIHVLTGCSDPKTDEAPPSGTDNSQDDDGELIGGGTADGCDLASATADGAPIFDLPFVEMTVTSQPNDLNSRTHGSGSAGQCAWDLVGRGDDRVMSPVQGTVVEVRNTISDDCHYPTKCCPPGKQCSCSSASGTACDSNLSACTCTSKAVLVSRGICPQGCSPADYGNYVLIQRAPGDYMLFAHLRAGSITVQAGSMVCPGFVIGRMGTTGFSTGNHTHWARTNQTSGQFASIPMGVRYVLGGQARVGIPTDGMVIRSTLSPVASCPQLACTPNATRCNAGVVYTCNPQGTGEVPASCPTGTCEDASTCAPQACVPNASRCTNGVLFTCNAQGTGETSSGCPTGFCQNATTCGSQSCVPNAVRCSGGVLFTCNGAGTGESSSSCPSGSCQSATTCTPQSCTPNAVRCAGGVLFTCNGAGTGESSSSCPSGSCQSATTCTPQSCTPNAVRCAGGVLFTCNGAGTGESSSSCPSGSCQSATTCTPQSCTPNAVRCAGGVLFTCNGAGTGESSSSCPSGSCQSATTCTPQSCTPNAVRCAGGVLFTCNGAGTGESSSSCPSGSCQSATTCTPQSCTPNAVRCAGGVLFTCNGAGTGESSSSCPSGSCQSATACSPASSCPDGVCDMGEDPVSCASDCDPVFLAQERLGQSTSGGCSSTNSGWHPAGGLVYWTFGTSCPLPSIFSPDVYGHEYGRWRFTIRKAGHYQINVKVPPSGSACLFAAANYTTGAQYLLARPGAGAAAINATLNQRANIGLEVPLFANVALNSGEMSLYLYDSMTDLTNCCECATSLRTFFDYARVTWVGP